MSCPKKVFLISNLAGFCHPFKVFSTLRTEGKLQCGSIKLQKGLVSSSRSRGVTFPPLSCFPLTEKLSSLPTFPTLHINSTVRLLKLKHNVWTSVNT